MIRLVRTAQAVFDGVKLKPVGACMRVLDPTSQRESTAYLRRLAVVEGVWRRFPHSLDWSLPMCLSTETGGPCDEDTTALWSLSQESVYLEQGCVRDLTGQGCDGALKGRWSPSMGTAGTIPTGLLRGEEEECYVEVTHDLRLDASREFTVEAWVQVPLHLEP